MYQEFNARERERKRELGDTDSTDGRGELLGLSHPAISFSSFIHRDIIPARKMCSVVHANARTNYINSPRTIYFLHNRT